MLSGEHFVDRAWPNIGPRPLPAMLLAGACLAAWPQITGAIVSTLQATVLRRSIVPGSTLLSSARSGALLWLGGAVGAALVIYAMEMSHDPTGTTFRTTLELISAGLVLGLVVGVGQYLAFGAAISRMRIWPIAVLVGYSAGSLLGGTVADIASRQVPIAAWEDQALAGSSVAGFVGGLVSGAISGIALAWIASERRPAESL